MNWLVTYLLGARRVCYIKPTVNSLSQESHFKERSPYAGLVLTLQITFYSNKFWIRIINDNNY